jgi:hypothetical protein
MKKWLCAAFLWILWSSSAWAAAAHVTNTCVTQNGASTSATVACTFTQGVVAGDLVTLFVATNNSITGVSSVTDDKADSCTIVDETTAGTTVHLTSVYCPNVTSGAQIFTATLSATGTLASIFGDEFSGIVHVTPKDKNNKGVQTTPGTGANAITSGLSGILSFPGELIVSGTINSTGAAGAGTISVGSSFTSGQSVTNTLRSEYQLQLGATTSLAGTFTASSASDSFATAMMTFSAGENLSKINAYSVLNQTGPFLSKLNAYAVLIQSEQASKINAYTVLCNNPGVAPCPAVGGGGAGGLLLRGYGN